MDFILIRGGNKAAPNIARESYWHYGIRNDYKPYGDIYMLDIHWDDYDWNQYMQLIYNNFPYIAMVADYVRPEQKDLMLQQIRDLDSIVGVICACPKFPGAAHDIPYHVRVGISIPAKEYAGYLPPLDDIAGRDLHLLGGNPHRQLQFALTAKTVGARVKSLDANYHVRKAGVGQYFDNGRWLQIRNRHLTIEQLAIISGKNIKRWFTRNYMQLETPLLL